MKKRKILTFIIIITLSSWIYINTFSYNIKSPHPNPLPNGEGIEQNAVTPSPIGRGLGWGIKWQKKTKKLNKNYEKKQLKKEIKRREKYHGNLLNYYNINFNENYLNLITDNSRILSSLRQKYYNEYLNI